VFSFLTPLQLFTLDTTLILTLLVVSVHMTFRAGLFSMATMGFAAVGGYGTAVLVTKYEWPTLFGVIAGVVMSATLAALFAAPVLRLRGTYFALGTVALAQAIVIGIANLDVTNTTLGISGIPRVVKTWHLLVILGVVFAFLQLESRSRFGRALSAVRLDERTANGLGINVRMLRFTTFVAAAGLAGLAGALEAHRTTVISPEQYGFGFLIPLLTYALVGGNGHWAGPVLTCWVLTALRRWVAFDDPHWEDFLYGTLLIGVMLLAPAGFTDPKILRKLGAGRRQKRLLAQQEQAVTATSSPPLTATVGSVGS
jgi:branched-chain amino acid transport system permease protein